MRLLSVNLADLVKQIVEVAQVPQTLQTEDLAYLSNAIENIAKAKQFDLAGVLEMAVFHCRKAMKIIEQLYLLRKDHYPEYQVLQAPFYYKVADSIASYIECNTDEMNNLKPLDLPEDPDDQSENGEAPDDAAEEQPASEANDEEPKIEDVIDSKQQQLSQKSQTEQIQDQIGNDTNELDMLSQDIFENLGLCEQILNDFRNGELLQDRQLSEDQLKSRKQITSALMIDTVMRRGEYGKFY